MMFAHRLTLFLLLAATTAESCTIPVFRYALDRWRADSFALKADEAWKKTETGRKAGILISESPANLLWIEDDTPEPGARLIWAGSEQPVSPDALKPADFDAAVTSPVRDKLAKRILAGECAVWILVESGDKKQDEAFAKRLEKRLKYLESVAAIPPQDPNDPESQLGPGPDLKVAFSMIRVKRDDPKERYLVKMLAGPTGKKLLDGKEPFAAPVFARGRVLGAWNSADLDDAGVDEISLFLLGACSCRVKTLNPGWDLLMNIDWDAKLMEAGFAKDREKPETAPATNTPEEPGSPAPPEDAP
jgi:hypothetical protein